MRDYNSSVYCLRKLSKVDHCKRVNVDGITLSKAFSDAADAIEELLKENGELENSGRVLMAAFARLKEKVPTWISVEKPPNDERNVFICHGNADFKAPCIGHYDASMKRFYEDKNWFASPIYDAMFWCEMPKLPLPAPPKEETNE